MECVLYWYCPKCNHIAFEKNKYAAENRCPKCNTRLVAKKGEVTLNATVAEINEKWCQKKGCNEMKDVQYVMVRNSSRPMTKQHKEFYCQKHLRERILQLELLRLSNEYGK